MIMEVSNVYFYLNNFFELYVLKVTVICMLYISLIMLKVMNKPSVNRLSQAILCPS